MVVFESDDSPEATTSRAAGITRNVDGIDTRGAAKNGNKNPDLSAFLKFELGEDVGWAIESLELDECKVVKP